MGDDKENRNNQSYKSVVRHLCRQKQVTTAWDCTLQLSKSVPPFESYGAPRLESEPNGRSNSTKCVGRFLQGPPVGAPPHVECRQPGHHRMPLGDSPCSCPLSCHTRNISFPSTTSLTSTSTKFTPTSTPTTAHSPPPPLCVGGAPPPPHTLNSSSGT